MTDGTFPQPSPKPSPNRLSRRPPTWSDATRAARRLAQRYGDHRWTAAFATLFAAYLTLGSIVEHMARYAAPTWGSAAATAVCAAACLLLPALPTAGAAVLTLVWSATPWIVGVSAGSATGVAGDPIGALVDGLSGGSMGSPSGAASASGWTVGSSLPNIVANVGTGGVSNVAIPVLPPNLEYAVLFAVGVAVFHAGLRCLPAPVAAIVIYTCGTLAVAVRAGIAAAAFTDAGFDVAGGLIATIVRFAVAGVAGYALREQMRRQATEAALERNRLLLERSRTRETVAAGLHDDVSNKLAFLLMVMDRRLEAGDPVGGEELRLMRKAAQEAYGTTRGLIRTLGRTPRADSDTNDDGSGRTNAESSGDAFDAPNAGTFGEAGSGPRDATNDGTYKDAFDDSGRGTAGVTMPSADSLAGYRWIGLIGERLRAHDARLAESGFDGTGLPPTAETAPPAIARPVLGETLAFIDECYANIVRHADPDSPYIVAVNATADRIIVSCADTVRGDEPVRHATVKGTGLTRHRVVIERLGGTLTASRDGDAWQCEAIIPYCA
ncbi:histidine kinase [Bifidobacterium amazonense]|uniref:histidine kinase n=1 Tax=Bifidobacterium amazonense TaxID=2809027 RepID=A0ABS9VUL3_9BIFI|nr:histidine kinase [Bifidobacterium amazonense]MCH9275789.1 histidine kinase [Bifidobacterium amazonense]